MITKFKKLCGIGNYREYHASGDGLDLKKNTAIYANNGYGKSTLVAVLRSFMEEDETIVQERKTLGMDIDQSAIVKIPGGIIKFENDKWETHPGDVNIPTISIFDDYFVQENFFVQEVESGHRKRIFRLIIGEEGKELSEAINAALQDEKLKRSAFSTYEKELEQKSIKAGVENYLEISDEVRNEAVKQLKEIKKQLKTIDNSLRIKGLLAFPDPKKEFIDLSNIKALLTKTLEEIREGAKQIVLKHIEEKLQPNPQAEEFLHLGTTLLKDGCPYCAQEIEGSGLIATYKTYFNKEYEDFQEELSKKIEVLSNWDFASFLHDLDTWNNDCEYALSEVRKHLGEEKTYSRQEKYVKYQDQIKKYIGGLVSQLREKKLDPSKQMPIDMVVALISLECEITNSIESFHEFLNVKKSEYKSLLELSTDQEKDQLLKEEERYQRILNRFTEDEEEWRKRYLEAEVLKLEAETERENLETQLSEKTRSVLNTYQDAVNYYLVRLRSQFQIGGFSSNMDRRSTEAYADFNIILHNTAVPLKSSSRSPSPEFCNTLSGGDRNTLSLALFFAWLDKQSGLEDMIVIFDDPLTSMDDNRRLGTAQVLGELSKRVKQLIVLTHKQDFLFQLDDELENLHTLTIKCDDMNGSVIFPYDIKYNRKDKHYQRIDQMIQYIDEDFGPSVSDMQQNIRKVLEKVLKIKYYPELQEFRTLGPMLDYVKENGYLDNDMVSELTKLKEISSPTHHAEEHGQPITDLLRDDLLPEIRKTLEVIKQL